MSDLGRCADSGPPKLGPLPHNDRGRAYFAILRATSSGTKVRTIETKVKVAT